MTSNVPKQVDRLSAEATIAAALLRAIPKRYVKVVNQYTTRYEEIVDLEQLRTDVAAYIDGKPLEPLR